MKTLSRVLIVLSFFMAALAAPAPAQIVKTVVTGTIVDPNGVPYAGGTIDATLIPTGTPTVAGVGQVDGYIQPVQIATNGSFTLPLYCNTAGGGCSVIQQSGTQWQFKITNRGAQPPVGFGGVSFTVTVTITGATQSITSQIAAAVPPLLTVFAAAGSGSTCGSTPGQLLYNAAGVCAGTPSVTSDGAGDITDGGEVITGEILANAAVGGNLALTCTPAPCSVQLGTNGQNVSTQVTGSVLSIATTNGATVGSPTGGALGSGTINAAGGIFVNNKPALTSAAAGTNVTPATANTNTTAAQNLQSIAYTAGTMNVTGKTYRMKSSGTLAVSAGGSVKTGLVINQNAVNVTGVAVFTPATTGVYSWSIDAECTTTNTSTGQIVCSGTQSFGGVSGTTQLDNATYPFFSTFNSVNLVTMNNALLQVQFSAGSTSNTATGDFMTLEFLN